MLWLVLTPFQHCAQPCEPARPASPWGCGRSELAQCRAAGRAGSTGWIDHCLGCDGAAAHGLVDAVVVVLAAGELGVGDGVLGAVVDAGHPDQPRREVPGGDLRLLVGRRGESGGGGERRRSRATPTGAKGRCRSGRSSAGADPRSCSSGLPAGRPRGGVRGGVHDRVLDTGPAATGHGPRLGCGGVEAGGRETVGVPPALDTNAAQEGGLVSPQDDHPHLRTGFGVTVGPPVLTVGRGQRPVAPAGLSHGTTLFGSDGVSPGHCAWSLSGVLPPCWLRRHGPVCCAVGV